jgi:5-(carboxyamino)imidazole ribonucleotide synthase
MLPKPQHEFQEGRMTGVGAINQAAMPVKTIGILGSGQLGRMLAIAAAQLGLKTHIFAPDAIGSPAAAVADMATTASYDDRTALQKFAKSVDVVTSEFENVPAATMDVISVLCPTSPGRSALEAAQHRVTEKTLAAKLGIATPRFWKVRSADDLSAALDDLNGAGILKTCRFGYDGKGQYRISTGESPVEIFAEFASDDAILEEHISFDREISCLLARDARGAIAHFPISQNKHENGILSQTIAPAPLDDKIADTAQIAAAALADELDLFGVLAVEFFVTKDGTLLFNEMAPRPHNSFHWTIEGATTSQFTQLARCLAGMGFGNTDAYGSWQMDNLLGQHMPQIPQILETPGVHLHLYGKPEARVGRKMGHTNRQISAK